jgi:hypothetical protein
MSSDLVEQASTGHLITVNLRGDRKMAPPVLVVDRPDDTGGASSK